jgi:hypothetical protein
MTISSKADLIEYALVNLGKPVIAIEVAPVQLEDRVNEALQFFQDFHYDGTERLYLKHQLLPTVVTVSTTVGFIPGEIAQAADGTHFQILSIPNATTFTARAISNVANVPNSTFQASAVITGQTTGSVCTFVSSIAGDTETGSVPISDMVTGIIRAIPWFAGTNSANYIFDPKYQVIMSTFQNLGSSSMIYFEQLMQHISLIDQVLRPIDSVRFNRKMGKVFLDLDWAMANPGDFIIFECYRILDPEVFTTIYNDRMLKKLVTAKVKHQWAQNTQKYQGIQLLGGVTIDASTLMAQAVAEIEAAEQEIRDSYMELPIGFCG